MHILFIAPRLPVPPDTGGKIRTLNILRQLAKKAELHLVCFSFEKHDEVLCKGLENDGIEVTLVPPREGGPVKKMLQVLSDPLPVSVSKYFSGQMKSILSELNETNQFDAVHVDHVHMSQYQQCFDGVPYVIDEHNVEYKILERCAGVERSLIKRMVFKDQGRKMKTFEARCLKGCSAYLAVSKEDKDLLDGLAGGHHDGFVVPNGVDTEYFQSPETSNQLPEGEDAMVFTGSMDWFPNDDAAIYFCEEILPRIWEVKPDIKFYIVGKGPSNALKEYAKGEERIILTGRVDDVRTYVERSKIFVVPLRIGGGTRLKILEAMSMEKAVVSTAIGAEGIDYTDDANIVIADKPEIFAQKVIILLKDSEKRKSLGGAGRKLVVEQYDWNIVGSVLDGIYEELKVKK